MRGIPGEVVMLNLLRLHDVADYAANPELAPEQPISGVEAYNRYIAHTLPFLTESGGALLFLGEGGPFLIGPEGERWDRAMLVKQSSVQALMAFAAPRSLSRRPRTPDGRRGGFAIAAAGPGAAAARSETDERG
jgi:hypothetical protein